MTTNAMVFPGQGAQAVGMGKGFYDTDSEVKALFQEASDVMGEDLAKICFEGPAETLMRTDITQPAIFVVSAAAFLKVKQNGITPHFVAGHSLGEITAYYAAGVLSFSDAVKVIRKRALAMAASCPPGTSGMAAVMGLNQDVIESVLSKVSHQPIGVANYNSLAQIVISGTKEGLEEGSAALKEEGGKVIPLKVGGAFHSPLMQHASDVLKEAVNEVTFSDADIPIILNRNAQPEQNAQALKENLSQQVISSVMWTKTVQYLADHVTHYIECGPGKVLSGLIKKTVQEKSISNIATPEDIDGVIEAQNA